MLAYRAACAAERSITWDDGDSYIPIGSLQEARAVVEASLAALFSEFKTGKYLLALSDAANWRKSVYPAYKANRRDKPRPVLLGPLRAWLAENHSVWQRPGLEADDVLGILSTSRRIIPGEKIIVSIDKDMKTIPGLFFNQTSGELMEITAREADLAHMVQTLTGDAADGYPGCPGVGPVKAGRILEQSDGYAEWWPLVVQAYEKAGLTEAEALTQARIARICRVTDYDYKKKEVKLWKL